MHGASLGPQGIDRPPVTVGGKSERAIEIAALHADGWNAGEADAGRYAELVKRLDETCIRIGRERPIAREVQVFVREIGLDGAKDALRRLEEAGAETAILVLDKERGADNVRRLAEAVL